MWQRSSIGALLLLVVAGAAAAQPANPSFYLVNKGRTAISRVYATPVGLPNWGQDRLGSVPVGPGQSFAVRLPADGTCVYDIRVVYAGGQSEDRRALNTCNVDSVVFPAGRAAAAARPERPADDPTFVLVNRSRAPVNELYLSITDDDSWGQDRLGDETVPAGSTRVIRLPPGECVYDLRVVFANGEASEKRRLNLCQIINLRVP